MSQYIIAVDFEATCELVQPRASQRKAEIIEFPAVLFNYKTGVIEEEFHHYVRPVEKPTLSEYCKNLTGIQQETVNRAEILPTVLSKFLVWLEKIAQRYDLRFPTPATKGNCPFVTWGDYDFQVFLSNECRRKNIPRPYFSYRWVNLKEVFTDTLRFRPYDFEEALRYLNMPIEGKLHSGLSDSRNLARMVQKLVEKNAILKVK